MKRISTQFGNFNIDMLQKIVKPYQEMFGRIRTDIHINLIRKP